MSCAECQNARESSDYRVFDPLCLWCGARYFQRLRTAPPVTVPDGMQERLETKAERLAWMERVLVGWEKQGHDRAAMRALAMDREIPYEPVTGKTAGTEAAAKPKRKASSGRARAAASAGPTYEEAD
jgi:hypothetical protein